MASSASIQAEITQYNAEIEQCREKIRKKRKQLDDEDLGFSQYVKTRASYERSFSNADEQSGRVMQYTNVCVAAERHTGRMDDLLRGSKKNIALERLQNIQQKLKMHIANTETELEDLYNELRRLQGRLAECEAAYRAAVQREEAEARAAAEAAAAAAAAQAAANAAASARGGRR